MKVCIWRSPHAGLVNFLKLIILILAFQAMQDSLKILQSFVLSLDGLLLHHVMFGYTCKGELKLNDSLLKLLW